MIQQLSFASDSLQERVASALVDAISQRLSEQGQAETSSFIQIEKLGLKAKHRCKGDFETRIFFSKHENFQGPLNVLTEAHDNDGKCGHWRFYPRVTIWMDMPVAAHAMAAGDELKIVRKKGRYDQVHGMLLNPGQETWQARTKIKKGQPITMDMARKMPMNFDGDKVQLLVKNQAVTIRAQGKLLSDAHLGQKVKVLSFATSSVIQGTLTQRDTVEIGASK